jgi:hypothetical protein
MPKMYSLYSLASMLPRRSSQAVSSKLSSFASVSLAMGMGAGWSQNFVRVILILTAHPAQQKTPLN